MWPHHLRRYLSVTASAVLMACVSASPNASRAIFLKSEAPPGLAVALDRFIHFQCQRNWNEVAKMLAPSYLASTSRTAETIALGGVSPLIHLEVRSINAPKAASSGLWLLAGCAEFEERGLNPKYEVLLMAEKVQEDWKFWFPEALLDCIDCPVRPCRLQRQ